MKDSETDPFVRKFRDRFERSVEQLDATTRSDITRARYRALEQNVKRRQGSVLWLPAGALATISLAVLVYGLLPQSTPVEEKTFIDEIEIISELDLYEDLEFYEWLEQNEIPS